MNAPATRSKRHRSALGRWGLFLTLLGMPLAAMTYAVLGWLALRSGVPLRVVQIGALVLIPMGAWFIARAAVRNAEGYQAREGRIVEDAPVWPARREWRLWIAIPLLVCVPLLYFSATVLVGVVLLNIAIAAAIVWIVLRTERRSIRRARRSEERCERCGYSLAETVSGSCPECGHDNSWPRMD